MGGVKLEVCALMTVSNTYTHTKSHIGVYTKTVMVNIDMIWRYRNLEKLLLDDYVFDKVGAE